MDIQVRCTKVGHNNMVIQGICMAEQCKSDQRIFCSICLQTLHIKCQNQFFEIDAFIDSLVEFKKKFQQSKDQPLINLLKELTYKSYQFIKVLESFAKNILAEYQKNNPLPRIDQILTNQTNLSAHDWEEGYKLLTDKQEIVPQNTNGLEEQLNQIKKSIDEITNIQSEKNKYNLLQIRNQSIEKWNHITEQNPLIIKTPHKIIAVALSPNDEYIASAGGDGDNSICIWDPITGQQVGSMKGHKESIWSINYSKCGKYIVSGSLDATIRQWNVANQEQLGETISGHTSYVYRTEYSPDQKYIVSCSQDLTLRLWDQKTGIEYIDKRIEHTTYLYCQSLSPISNEIAFGDFHGTISIWDYEQHQLQYELEGHDQRVRTLKYSNDGKLIISGSDDNTLILWDVQARTLLRQFKGHTSFLLSVNLSKDQKYIVSGGCDNSVIVWNLVTGKQISQIRHSQEDEQYVYSVQFSSCGKFIITGALDKEIRIMVAPIDE